MLPPSRPCHESPPSDQELGKRSELALRLCYRCWMGQALNLLLSLTTAAATAILLGLIARDDMGMSADIVRVDALSTAGLIFAVVAGGSLLKRKK